MNIRYDIAMDGQNFYDTWQESNDKKSLDDNAFDLVNTSVFAVIHQISDHSGEQTSHGSVVSIKDRLNEK